MDKKLNSIQSQRLGEVLATLHQTVDAFNSNFTRPVLNSEYLLDRSLQVIALLYKHRQSDLNYLQTQVEIIKTQLDALKLPNSAPAYGICVGDVHSGNAHFTQQNEPTLFDFDQCGYGWRAFDIAKFVHRINTWKIDIKLSNLFLQGYQSVRQLDAAELDAIPVFVKVAHIWVMGISASVVGHVLPYGWFTDEWLDVSLATFRSLNDSNNSN